MAERDVQYDFDVVEEDLTNIGQESRSVLVDQLDRVKATETAHGRWVRIASYGKSAAASSAAKSLRERFGDSPEVSGFLFRSKRDEMTEGSTTPRYGLFVRFTPDAIVDGELGKWQAQYRAKMAAEKAKRDQKKAADAEKAKAAVASQGQAAQGQQAAQKKAS